jgi:pantothenate kinase
MSCKKKGCTDSSAANYDPNAEISDGSCIAKAINYGTIRVESICGDSNSQTEHLVACEVYQEISDFMFANIGSPCNYYTFTDKNGQEISGYIRSITGC